MPGYPVVTVMKLLRYPYSWYYSATNRNTGHCVGWFRDQSSDISWSFLELFASSLPLSTRNVRSLYLIDMYPTAEYVRCESFELLTVTLRLSVIKKDYFATPILMDYIKVWNSRRGGKSEEIATIIQPFYLIPDKYKLRKRLLKISISQLIF